MSSKRILIIDDEVAILDALKLVLEGRGHQICTVSRPEDFSSSLEIFQPEVIFVDLSMPGMDGVTVTKRIKTDPGTRHIPVIVISAHLDTEQRAREAGADDYLEKPFRVNDFLAKVTALCERT